MGKIKKLYYSQILTKVIDCELDDDVTVEDIEKSLKSPKELIMILKKVCRERKEDPYWRDILDQCMNWEVSDTIADAYELCGQLYI